MREGWWPELVGALIGRAIVAAVIFTGVWYVVDRRALKTELYMTKMVVDAVQGFPAWREHVRRHPGDLLRED